MAILPDPNCPTCGGKGAIDSGGFTPWDTPIDIACPSCVEPQISKQQMAPQAQREAIAIACGFTFDDQAYDWMGEQGVCRHWRLFGPNGKVIVDGLPDYLYDLNAMDKAQKTLTWVETCNMYNYLDEICERPARVPDFDGVFRGGVDMTIKRVWQASAEQRAEAWLRAKGLWVV